MLRRFNWSKTLRARATGQRYTQSMTAHAQYSKDFNCTSFYYKYHHSHPPPLPRPALSYSTPPTVSPLVHSSPPMLHSSHHHILHPFHCPIGSGPSCSTLPMVSPFHVPPILHLFHPLPLPWSHWFRVSCTCVYII